MNVEKARSVRLSRAWWLNRMWAPLKVAFRYWQRLRPQLISAGDINLSAWKFDFPSFLGKKKTALWSNLCSSRFVVASCSNKPPADGRPCARLQETMELSCFLRLQGILTAP